MKKLPSILSLFLLLLLGAACRKSPVDPGGGGAGNGLLKGIVYSPNGQVPLPSVTIEAIVNGTKKQALSDKNGNFSLELPAGGYDVTMYAGAGSRLSVQKHFTIEAGRTLTVPAAQSSLRFSAKIAFIAGEFDAIQALVQEMGIPATALTAEEAQDYNTLKQYDVLLLNCGSELVDYENHHKHLERFLNEGHSIYASDWEIEKLSKQDWGFLPANLLSYNREGEAGITEGSVLFEPFKTALGKSKITIEFDLPGYVQLSNVVANDPRFQVLVDHPQKGPLALNIQWGPKQTSSTGTTYGGNIIFTTFHDASLSTDVKAVLRQMILAL